MSRSVQRPPSQGRGYSVRGLMSVGGGSGAVIESRPLPSPRPGRAARPAPMPGAGAQLLDRRRDARARDLGEQADLVVPPAAPRHRPLPEVRVGRVVDDAFLAGRFERRRLRLAEDAVPAVDQRVHVRVDRIGRRHHEDARAAAAHLVLVEPHGGEPVVPQQLRRVLALLLREHVHVAVVVVADVRVIEVRDRAVAYGVPTFRLNQSVTMIWPSGLRLGTSSEDHVVEDLLHRRRVVGRQPVHQLERHLRRADLGRVDAAGDEQRPACPAGRSRRARGSVGAPPWKYSLPLELLVAIEVLERLRRADLERDERVAVAGLAELAAAARDRSSPRRASCTRRSCPSAPACCRRRP